MKKPAKGRPGPFDALRALRDEIAKKDVPPPAKKAPAPKLAQRSEGPEDEALLFHRLFAGVVALDGSPGRLPRVPLERSEAVAHASKRGADASRQEAEDVREHLRTLVEGRGRFEVADDGATVEGRRVDLPIAALRRLRRGSVPIDARLDLHGMGMDAARARLDSFLRTTRARGERCVLVIHGKGEHSPGGVGLLRGEIAAWLSQGASSAHVAAFATARREDGGEGATYVLLRR